jgi:uncharacterized protein (TIGR03067 family)
MARSSRPSNVLAKDEVQTDLPKAPDRIEEHWDEPDLSEGDDPVVLELAARSDLERLQGSWLFVAGRRHAAILISGGRFSVRFKDGYTYTGTFDLVPGVLPRAIDMFIEDGPERHKGKTALCVYELIGSRLRWCATEPGTRERLTAFPSVEDPNHLCLVFQREE